MPKQEPTIQTICIEDGCQRTDWSDPTIPTDYDVMVEEKSRLSRVQDIHKRVEDNQRDELIN